MQLSIIIPVYNVQDHLARCLDSIFEQEGACSFEVIAIDDGSTDASLELLRTYKEKHPSLILMEHGHNRKLSAARTTGMRAATGRYIMHVDSDDWLLPGALAALCSVIERDSTDVIMFNHVKAGAAGILQVVKTVEAEKVVKANKKILPHFFKSCWNKVVRRELVRNMVYQELSLNHSEDFIFGVEVLIRAEEVTLLPGVYYAYFQNPASLTKTVNMRELIETKTDVLGALKMLKEKYGDCDSVIAGALYHQVKMIHKRFALHSLNDGSEVEWGNVLRLVDAIEGRQLLSQEIVKSCTSVSSRVHNLYKYWGPKWALSYVVNGLVLPQVGLGWKRRARASN